MDKKVHFSVDDTLGCFAWLDRNVKSIKSIFDSTTFCFAREIYEKYGVPTSFYCMYTDGDYLLGDSNIELSEQFQQNQDWLKLGFHCYNALSDYSKVSYERIQDDYQKVVGNLKKITGGGACLTDTIRLHFFAGNDIVVNFLRENGIKKLLCADDDRKSYNLSFEQEKVLKRDGVIYDERTQMNYAVTNIRLERANNIKDEIERINKLGWDTVVIFTHERYLKEPEIKKRLERFLKEFV